MRLVAARPELADHANRRSGPDPLVIGKRIRHRRRSCGLTLDALGERVGLSASAVSLIETGKREAKVSTLAALAEALDCQLSDLLTEAAPSRRAASAAARGPLHSSTHCWCWCSGIHGA